jgi:hypothetical protein
VIELLISFKLSTQYNNSIIAILRGSKRVTLLSDTQSQPTAISNLSPKLICSRGSNFENDRNTNKIKSAFCIFFVFFFRFQKTEKLKKIEKKFREEEELIFPLWAEPF